MFETIASVGSRALAVILTSLLIAVICRVFFFIDPSVANTFQGLLSEIAWPILTFAMAAYGLNKGLGTMERISDKKLEATKNDPRLPTEVDETSGAG